MSARRAALPAFESLLAQARKLFAPDGSLSDDASPALASLRTRLRRRRSEIASQLSKMLESRREILGDGVVVLRNDRYCLPVLASHRARLPGIVHDRSGSGQTVFVEPLEVLEANNDLALLAGEERREAARVLAAFGREVLAAGPDLERAVDVLAALDALEARVEFGETSGGRVPEISDDEELALVAARHPLLDPRLAPLRRRVLGESRAARDIVPLDLTLPRETRLLVVSGPNAGGKTVVLKTAGLFALLAQSGFPVPAAAGTRLPFFSSLRTEIGDAQEILSDRSTFSSSMETLGQILEEAAPGSLALLDEIGTATDPEEGGALAVAFLEEYLARGGRAIVTTHLSAVKAFAASRPDAVSAAMEFDEATGRPNYRIHPGLSGRSRALSVAKEMGLPESVLDRAREILGEAWRRREESETRAEEALERLRTIEADLTKAREEATAAARRLDAERAEAAREKARMLEEGLAGFERARKELARSVSAQLDLLRQETAQRAQASSERLLAQAEQTLAPAAIVAEAREAAIERARALSPGDAARWKASGVQGTIVELEEQFAWLEIAGKRMRVPREELEPAEAARAKPPKRRGAVTAPEPAAAGVAPEILVIGKRVEEAIEEVEKALDAALLSGASSLRVVHGHGTGRLRDGLRDHFRRHPSVARLSAAGAREGGDGATMLELK
ncbi:MAG TPA: Smr/MutS family protein [Thermoanaerobaculia bacterium]